VASLNSHPGRWGRLVSSIVRRGRRLLGRLIGDRPMPVPPHSRSLTGELPVWPSPWLMRHRLIRYRRPFGLDPAQGLLRSGSGMRPGRVDKRPQPVEGLLTSHRRMRSQPREAHPTSHMRMRPQLAKGLRTSHNNLWRPELVGALIKMHKRIRPEPVEGPSSTRSMRPETVQGLSSMRPAPLEGLIEMHKRLRPMHPEPVEGPSSTRSNMRPKAVEWPSSPRGGMRLEAVEEPSRMSLAFVERFLRYKRLSHMHPEPDERPSSMRPALVEGLGEVHKRLRPMHPEPVEGPSSMRPETVERPSGVRLSLVEGLIRVHRRIRPMHPEPLADASRSRGSVRIALVEGLIRVQRRMRPMRPETVAAATGLRINMRREAVERPNSPPGSIRTELVETPSTLRSSMRNESIEKLTSSMRPEPLDEPTSPGLSGASPSLAPPETRWHAALTKAPLESAQPLAGRWASLARIITGRTHTRYTTGPATRRALRAAGALGATTGSVIHLSRAPSARVDATVIAHELVHSRTPVQRPRFLLAAHSSHEEEERMAQRAARQVSPGGPSLHLQRAVQPLGQRPVTEVAQARELATAGRFLPGLVDTLPVTGIGGLVEAARTAAGPFAGPQTAVSGLAAAAGLPPGSFPAEMAQAAGPALSSPLSVDNWAAAPSAIAASVPPSAAGGQAGAESFGGSARDATAGGPLPVSSPAAAGSAGPGVSPSAALGVADLDCLLDALEDNVLRELERRGGRYEGVF
jgi:hypothetical protein